MAENGQKLNESTQLYLDGSVKFDRKSTDGVEINVSYSDKSIGIYESLSHSGSNVIINEPDNTPEPEQTEPKFKISTLPARAKWTLVLCVIAIFLASCSLAIIGPFYPIVAENKEMSVVTVGWVFGVYQVAIFVTTPLFGSYLTTIGTKFVYIGGVFVLGAVNILFGFLDNCPNGTPFITLSIMCRIVMGLGSSGFLTASFAIVSSEFPDHIGFCFGLLETGAGMGYLVGPLIGGVMYEYGGYGCPFFVIGSCVLVIAMLMYTFLPPVDIVNFKRKGSMFYLLKSPSIIMALFVVFCGSLGITTWEVTLAQHLEPFHLNSAIVGALFCITAVVYSLIAPFYGYLSDTKDIQAPLMVGGVFFFGIGFLILGPSRVFPFLPYKIWTICCGLVMIGLTLGTTLVPTVKCMVKGAVELGYENNLDTYGLVSGLYNAVLTFAGFVGPISSTALVSAFDIETSYTFIGATSIFVAIISGLYFSIRECQRRKVNRYEEL